MTAHDSAGLEMSTTWGTRQIRYVLHREPRRDLLIAVHPDCTVRVRAPAAKPIEQVLKRIDARRSWIARRLVEFEEMTPLPPPRFVSGETVLYLGREYRLRVEQRGRGTLLHGGRLIVRVPSGASTRFVRERVDGWFRGRARDVALQRMLRLQTGNKVLSGLNPALRIRSMTRRWGSCTATGTVTINPALLQAPSPCVDYVLVHEMVHLLEQAHSPRFYTLLTRAMPDWRERRERLARAAIRWAE